MSIDKDVFWSVYFVSAVLAGAAWSFDGVAVSVVFVDEAFVGDCSAKMQESLIDKSFSYKVTLLFKTIFHFCIKEIIMRKYSKLIFLPSPACLASAATSATLSFASSTFSDALSLTSSATNDKIASKMISIQKNANLFVGLPVWLLRIKLKIITDTFYHESNLILPCPTALASAASSPALSFASSTKMLNSV